MYIKTKNNILNLNLGNIYVGRCFDGYIVFYAPDLTDDSTYITLYKNKSNKAKCEKYLEALWAEMRRDDSAFIDADNLYYRNWIEDIKE